MNAFIRSVLLGRDMSLCLGVLLGIVTMANAGRADEKAGQPNKKSPAVSPQKAGAKPATATAPASEKKVVITGSLIPQKVDRHGSILNTAQNVYVIDREQMERYGAATTTDALRRLSGVGFSGR